MGSIPFERPNMPSTDVLIQRQKDADLRHEKAIENEFRREDRAWMRAIASAVEKLSDNNLRLSEAIEAQGDLIREMLHKRPRVEDETARYPPSDNEYEWKRVKRRKSRRK